ncbi:ABC-2 type transport system permease protein [Seinonella peptonophila]|uniref:ABC-2 type transport system permease protein n=1 Tax=Seinonella peptonophila TaxID=112248 RepID=A0A1M4X3Q7_9BACL|nr:ABC transporter permease [Seinonella peptonophila]SHE88085.1 ABC-2 type transport system permease protein [Seinonella peptonophila]
MNIWSMTLKEILVTIRNKRAFIFMLAFPIILILILGTALSNNFENTSSIGKIHILYYEEQANSYTKPFHDFMAAVKKSDLSFEKTTKDAGKQAIAKAKADGYIELSNKGIDLYVNNTSGISASVIQGLLKGFSDQYNLISEVIKVNPQQAKQLMASSSPTQHIKYITLNPGKKPNSMDYYAVVISTMITLFGALSTVALVHGENIQRTADRLLLAPIHRYEIFIGKMLGSLFVNGICVLLLVGFSKYVLHTNWGNHLWIVILILLSSVLLATSLGLMLSYILQNSASARTIIMIFANTSALLGGSWFAIPTPGWINFLSPLTWENEAVLKVIYANDFTATIPTFTYNLGFSVLCLLIAIFSLRRREGL